MESRYFSGALPDDEDAGGLEFESGSGELGMGVCLGRLGTWASGNCGPNCERYGFKWRLPYSASVST